MSTRLDSERLAVPDEHRRSLHDALVSLLSEHSLHEFTAEELLAAADLKKTTFYTYYPSKEAVFVELLRSVISSLRTEITVDFARSQHLPTAIASMLHSGLAHYLRNGPVLKAASEEWASIPEVKRIWLGSINYLVNELAAEIDTLREDHRAPRTLEPSAIATALVWTSERTAYMHFTQQLDDLREMLRTVDALTEVFLGSILMEHLPERTAPPRNDDEDAETTT